jgi:hypothetical protein
MANLDEQISVLQEKLQLHKLRQQRLEARRHARDALRERKAVTRRKILVGGLILDKLERGELDRNLITGWLEQALTRAADRALFDLPALKAVPGP